MVHRRDLVERFAWLEGSEYYEDVLDETLVAIAFVAHGYRGELVEYGAAWAMASYAVEVFGLEDLVEKARAELFGKV